MNGQAAKLQGPSGDVEGVLKLANARSLGTRRCAGSLDHQLRDCIMGLDEGYRLTAGLDRESPAIWEPWISDPQKTYRPSRIPILEDFPLRNSPSAVAREISIDQQV